MRQGSQQAQAPSAGLVGEASHGRELGALVVDLDAKPVTIPTQQHLTPGACVAHRVGDELADQEFEVVSAFANREPRRGVGHELAGRRCRLGALGERNRRGFLQCSHDVPVPDDERSDSGHGNMSHRESATRGLPSPPVPRRVDAAAPRRSATRPSSRFRQSGDPAPGTYRGTVPFQDDAFLSVAAACVEQVGSAVGGNAQQRVPQPPHADSPPHPSHAVPE